MKAIGKGNVSISFHFYSNSVLKKLVAIEKLRGFYSGRGGGEGGGGGEEKRGGGGGRGWGGGGGGRWGGGAVGR